jgi:hypothetical protein
MPATGVVELFGHMAQWLADRGAAKA